MADGIESGGGAGHISSEDRDRVLAVARRAYPARPAVPQDPPVPRESYAYTRCSAVEQAAGSLPRQSEVCMETAARYGKHIREILVETETGFSTHHRAQFAKLLSLIRAGRVSEVFCETDERLGRDAADMMMFIKAVKKHGVAIYTQHGLQDPDTIAHNIIAKERQYQEQKVRLIDGAVRAKAGGKVLGRAPYGLMKHKKWGLIEDPFTRSILKRIFMEAREGKSASMIARGLNVDGILSPNGKRWCNSTIYSIIRNPVYVGLLQYNYTTSQIDYVTKKQVVKELPESERKTVEVPHAVLIDADTFVGANQGFRTSQHGEKGERRKFLLRGRIGCGRCGGDTHFSVTRRRDGVTDIRVVCKIGHEDGPEVCGGFGSHSYAHVESLVLGAMVDTFSRPDDLADFVRPYREKLEARERTRLDDIRRLEAEMAAIEDEEDEIIAARARRKVDDDRFDKFLDGKKVEKAAKTAALRLLSIETTPIDVMVADCAKISGGWSALAPDLPFNPRDDAGRALFDALRGIVTRVVIHPEEPGFIHRMDCDFLVVAGETASAIGEADVSRRVTVVYDRGEKRRLDNVTRAEERALGLRGDLAGAGEALGDAIWQTVEGAVDLTRIGMEFPRGYRFFLSDVFHFLRHRIDFAEFPGTEAEKDAFWSGVDRLCLSLVFEDIVAVLAEREPAFLAGVDLSPMRVTRRRPSLTLLESRFKPAPDAQDRLSAAHSACTDPQIRKRLEVVFLRLTGSSRLDAAKEAGVSPKVCDDNWRTYMFMGLDEILRTPSWGRYSKLTDEQTDRVLDFVNTHAAASKAGRPRLRMAELLEMVRDEFGIEYSAAGLKKVINRNAKRLAKPPMTMPNHRARGCQPRQNRVVPRSGLRPAGERKRTANG